MDKLLEYLNALEPAQRTAFCDACETSEGYLRKAISIRQQLGVKLCIAIERESKRAIRCEYLSPSADWQFIRGTRRTRLAEPAGA